MNEKFRSVISHSSDDKIKVVYSWHGPKGPLWNTELPNILTFADMAEGVNPMMESRNFWTDDVWNKQFSKDKNKYELFPCQGIESDDKRPFIYPFSLTWRVGFETYFTVGAGVLEYSHMPIWLLHQVKTGNGYILLDHSVEAFMSDTELDAMFSYFHKDHTLPMYKIIYLTGTINAQHVYDTWAENKGISNTREHRMCVVPYASSREIFHSFFVHGHHIDGEYQKILDIPDYDVNYVPPKVFLSWNRRFRRHRIYLALILEELNLIDRCFISFAKIDGERATNSFAEQVKNLQDPINIYGNNTFHIDHHTPHRLENRLPLVIDGETDIVKMCEDYGFTRTYYKDTLVSLITETNFSENECTLTEKSFKPIFNMHPFIIVGVPGAMQAMRDLGFKTFGDFWNEDYDSEADPGNRLIKIKNVLQEIASWNDDQIRTFKQNVKPILTHNYGMLKEPGSVAIINNIYNHITTNFNPDWTNWCIPGECHFENHTKDPNRPSNP